MHMYCYICLTHDFYNRVIPWLLFHKMHSVVKLSQVYTETFYHSCELQEWKKIYYKQLKIKH